jgi:hypothetical protein
MKFTYIQNKYIYYHTEKSNKWFHSVQYITGTGNFASNYNNLPNAMIPLIKQALRGGGDEREGEQKIRNGSPQAVGWALQYLPGTPAAALTPTVSVCLSVGPCQQCQEGDPGGWALQDFHIICPVLHLERLLQHCCSSVWHNTGSSSFQL